MGNFVEDLKFGNNAETWLAEQFGLTPLDGRTGDFILPCSAKLELKCDKRSSTNTGNMYIEVFSNAAKKSVGGPIQAASHGCKYFAYLFWGDKKLYLFNTYSLLAFLVSSPYTAKKVQYSNASGFIVPLADLQHLFLNFEEIIKGEK